MIMWKNLALYNSKIDEDRNSKIYTHLQLSIWIKFLGCGENRKTESRVM